MDDKVTYGYTHDINVRPSMWSSNKDFIIKWANDDNPAKRPFFIVRRTEVLNVIDIVGGKDYCESCIFNPPSSGDGKPYCMCDPSDELLNCHIRRDDNG